MSADLLQKAVMFFDIDNFERLCIQYTIDYGLAIRGLIQHHDVDPVDYDIKVDQSLPIEDLLSRDEKLRQMIQNCSAHRWAFTNAGLPHATRVLKTLGVNDLFEGIIYCDYTEPDFPCKPYPEAYIKAMKMAGVSDPKKCFLVDDSIKNINAAKEMGWTAILVTESKEHKNVGDAQIEEIYELSAVLPQLFRQ
ncbi:hypothetical protein BB559_006700 [Furculomyces boomerangus]|uniref:Pyrimidine 5'-nucleotidase n=2 Tax=Harpellales TaxID=61421 RepID=A0A2T9Y144_9FUNG|nr:hypothetical protein BB559_006700 [Furculomyces boomerangus]PWA03293.1 hypothetical protein BB558_000538 [Smittium angustum]